MTFYSFDQRLGLWINLNFRNAKSPPWVAGRALSNPDGFSHFHDCETFARIRAKEPCIGNVLGFVL